MGRRINSQPYIKKARPNTTPHSLLQGGATDLGGMDCISQVDTTDTQSNLTSTKVDINCGKCHTVVHTDAVYVSALKCCLCEVSYHGSCLELNSTLISFLHVVADVGGWCCLDCRKVDNKKITNPTARPKKENINTEIAGIKEQLQSITELLRNTTSLKDLYYRVTDLNTSASNSNSISQPYIND